MVKSTSIFVCQSCSYEAGKWMGRCPQCNAWNSFLEEAMPDKKTSNKNITQKGKKQTLIKLSEIDKQEHKRLPTGVSELDRTLGGGLVEGSLVLLSGDPGIGKSTLVSQVLENIGGIYACAEESPRQVKLRFERMSAKGESVYFVPDNQLENILATVESQKTLPKILVIDSIQTVFTAFIRSSIGSASQIKECANILLQFAKKTGVCVFIIGHITKEGAIAGPKILEHLVDTVLYLAGDKNHQGRLAALC